MGDERVTDRIALWVIGFVSSLIVVAVAFLLLGHRPHIGTVPDVSTLPVLNALLNATSAVLLLAGYLFIRQRKVTAHIVAHRKPAPVGIHGELDACVTQLPLDVGAGSSRVTPRALGGAARGRCGAGRPALRD